MGEFKYGHEQAVCASTSKIRYADLPTAQLVANHMNSRYHQTGTTANHPFHCADCDDYHIGHASKGTKHMNREFKVQRRRKLGRKRQR